MTTAVVHLFLLFAVYASAETTDPDVDWALTDEIEFYVAPAQGETIEFRCDGAAGYLEILFSEAPRYNYRVPLAVIPEIARWLDCLPTEEDGGEP